MSAPAKKAGFSLAPVILAAVMAVPVSARAAAPATVPSRIEHIDLVHFSHTDIGFTDHPVVCRELQRRYLDIALDAILATHDRAEGDRFRWTAEAMVSVSDWWQAASEARRGQFLRAIDQGQLEVTALPCNQAPFLDADQWQTMLHWTSDDLWKAWRPRLAMQNDVNGFPRAGAIRLLDRGVRWLMMGINSDSGGPPFKPPYAFWWKMPDGRRMLVWQGFTYPSGYDFFHRTHWRRGPVPAASDTAYRPPRPGEQFAADEPSVRAAHAICTGRLAAIEKAGYRYPNLILPFTNQWRMDNDPPFPPLADFVAAWNRLCLRPTLRLTLASQAMERLEKASGDMFPEHQGEWTDWWANGMVSNPREVIASRQAKRALAAAAAPVWGALEPADLSLAQSIRRELCLFDEHTAGAAMSVADPYSLDTLGQFNEKGRLAYKPLAEAQWLLARRMRTQLTRAAAGLYVANPTDRPWSGWVSITASALRDPWEAVEQAQTRVGRPLLREPGFEPWGRPRRDSDLSRENTAAVFPDRAPGRVVKFWVDDLPPQSVTHFRGLTKAATAEPASDPKAAAAPQIEKDQQGWPASARWDRMPQPLFTGGLGDFLSVEVNGFAPRALLGDMSRESDARKRDALRIGRVVTVPAEPEAAVEQSQTDHTLVFHQWLRHPRLRWAWRRLEIHRREPRATLTLRLDRLSSFAPERFFAVFPFPTGQALPTLSNGGVPFVPFADQLPGACRDYFAIDGWARYAGPQGHWLWASADAPLVTLGSPAVWDRRTQPPANPGRLLAMLYDNFWYTNFTGDCPGVMTFRFELAWKPQLDNAQVAASAQTLCAEPCVLIQPAMAADPHVDQGLNQP